MCLEWINEWWWRTMWLVPTWNDSKRRNRKMWLVFALWRERKLWTQQTVQMVSSWLLYTKRSRLQSDVWEHEHGRFLQHQEQGWWKSLFLVQSNFFLLRCWLSLLWLRLLFNGNVPQWMRNLWNTLCGLKMQTELTPLLSADDISLRKEIGRGSYDYLNETYRNLNSLLSLSIDLFFFEKL